MLQVHAHFEKVILMILWTEEKNMKFSTESIGMKSSVLISSFILLTFFTLFSFGWRIYYSCFSFSQGVSTSTRFEVRKFNRSEVKIEMRQLNLGAPFPVELSILSHMYCRDPCRGQISVKIGLQFACSSRINIISTGLEKQFHKKSMQMWKWSMESSQVELNHSSPGTGSG